jgi:hypothetical protein
MLYKNRYIYVVMASTYSSRTSVNPSDLGLQCNGRKPNCLYMYSVYGNMIRALSRPILVQQQAGNMCFRSMWRLDHAPDL